MRFVDEAKILVKAGKGGRGCMSFRREKFVPRGGPDGGDGGNGGSVYLRADNRLLSLYDFKFKKIYEAQNGKPGEGRQCDGKKGADLVIGLPVGTLVYAEGQAIRPASANIFNSRRSVSSSPGSPGWAKRGARMVEDLKCSLPLPPRPPRAASTMPSGSLRSASKYSPSCPSA